MTIRAFLQVRGVELRLGSPKRSSAPVRQRKIDPHEAISMLARGMRPREIAEHYGVAEDVVRQVLTDGGVEFRGGA